MPKRAPSSACPPQPINIASPHASVELDSGGGGGDGGSGRRILEGCYVNIDEYKSRLAYLCTRYGGGERMKRVGNQDVL